MKTKRNLLLLVGLAALCGAASAQTASTSSTTSSGTVPQRVRDGLSETYGQASSALSRGLDAVAENVAPFKLGVTASMNASRFSASGYDAKLGFGLGLTAIFDASDLWKNSYVRTGLLFERLGVRYTQWLDPELPTGSATPGEPLHMVRNEVAVRTCYLQVPARYGYSWLLKKDWTLLAETGPYVAIGLGGKVDHEGKFFADTDAHRFDLGWGLHGGLLLHQDHQVMIGWDWGFINMNDAYCQNRNFMVSYAYYFR